MERFLLNPTVLFEITADLEEEGKTYLNFHKDFDELILRYESQLQDKFAEITDGMLSSHSRRKLDKSIRYHTQLIRSENDEPSMIANRSISLDIQQDEGEKSVNNDDPRLMLGDLIDSISMLGETNPGDNSVSPIYSPTSTPGSRAGSEANEVTNLTPVNAQNYLSPFNIRNNALSEFQNRPTTGTPRPQPPSTFVIYNNLLTDYSTPVSSPTPGRLPATPRQIPSPATTPGFQSPKPPTPGDKNNRPTFQPVLTRGKAREKARVKRIVNPPQRYITTE